MGIDTESGDLLAIYEWVLHCRPAKKGDTRRQKQVRTAALYLAQYTTCILLSILCAGCSVYYLHTTLATIYAGG